MRLPAIASLVLFVLLSSFILFFFSSFASAGSARFAVYIQADGTVYGTIVDGTSSIQRDGDVYTFVGNVSYPLYVQRDNIVIDGAGYTLISDETRGIVLADRHNVTLRNARVMVGKGSIVDVAGATDCALIGNTLIGNPQPIPYLPPPKTPLIGPEGVRFSNSQNITVKDNMIKNFSFALSLYSSSGCTITGNTLVDGSFGIYLSDTVDCVFRNNSLFNSRFYVTVHASYGCENDLDSSNTVDGKPIYYWKDVKDAVVPSDSEYVVLLRCKNMTIENASPQDIALISTSNSTIRGVEVTGRSSGISLLDCSSISILDNALHDGAVGIDLQDSSNNIIKGNEVSNYITSSIRLTSASNNLISGNIFTNNSNAISVSSFQVPLGNGNVIASNNFTKNANAIIVPCSMEIVGNIFEENNNAICLSESSSSIITQNTFTNNNNSLYISDASNNYIYLNNFLSNDHQVTDAGVSSPQASTQPAKTSSSLIASLQLVTVQVDSVNFFPPPPPSTNYWDNGTKGNYWSDYHGSDANRDGIGDTAYYLYENNQDNYPLMKPVTVSEPPTATLANTTLNDDAQVPEGTVGAALPIEYVVAAILTAAAVIAAAWACLFLKHEKSVVVTKASKT